MAFPHGNIIETAFTVEIIVFASRCWSRPEIEWKWSLMVCRARVGESAALRSKQRKVWELMGKWRRRWEVCERFHTAGTVRIGEWVGYFDGKAFFHVFSCAREVEFCCRILRSLDKEVESSLDWCVSHIMVLKCLRNIIFLIIEYHSSKLAYYKVVSFLFRNWFNSYKIALLILS